MTRAIEAGTDRKHKQIKVLTPDELATFIAVTPARWQTLFRVLAATGLRISEAFALRWRDIELDGSSPHVSVTRAYVRGRFGPPKSKKGYRDVPIDHNLVVELRKRRKQSEWPGDDDLVFGSANGKALRQENVRRRALEVGAQEANVPWVGFHTFRHTCASRLFAEGRNVVQIQRWLGHHSPSFTLDTYVDLLDGDLGAPLASSLARVNKVPAQTTDTTRNGEPAIDAEIAELQAL